MRKHPSNPPISLDNKGIEMDGAVAKGGMIMQFTACRETVTRLLSTDSEASTCDSKVVWVFVACLGMEEDRGGSNRKSIIEWGSVVY